MASGASTTLALMLDTDSLSFPQRLIGIASCCFGPALAGARYIAIPIDGLDVIELSPISASANHQLVAGSPAPANGPRMARQTPESSYVPLAVSTLHHAESAHRPDRPAATAHVYDYVDFGAHTGPNGAFSWYADYPSQH
ncbi:uncharacterized protein LOC106638328 [Copidosoma floridanum]|uniref:uncharacterized protein LOC106638328 n=1 Tax=Copidosoma floridanum TaxID=29053 RepID=UPI0006C9DB17|nr:uncharacterized protein LOC106638328 [Copidosoma floridanum]